jgi:hypothetical protein
MDMFIFILICISGIIFLIIAFLIFKRIKHEKMKKIYKLTFFVLLLVSAFLFSIYFLGDDNYLYILIIGSSMGMFIFLYSIIYMIKYKKFNYLILTPFLLFAFCLSGIYYEGRDYRKIAIIADNIITYYNGNNSDNNDLLNNLKVPKNMEIYFMKNVHNGKIYKLLDYFNVSQEIEKYIEDDEIIIYYKGLIYLVRRGRYIE